MTPQLNVMFPKWMDIKWLVLLGMLSLVFPLDAWATYRYEITPSIAVSEIYDDNIDLEDTDEESDYITAVTPGILFTALSPKTNLSLEYSPTFTWYDDNSDNDTTRHLGRLDFARQLSQHVRFHLANTFVYTEDPLEEETLEETADVTGNRNSRETYWRNIGSVSFDYLFGPENVVSAGYRNSILKNDDPTLDDSSQNDLFTSLTYWFDQQNGLALNYGFVQVNYSAGDRLASDDVEGHNAGIQYNRRFQPQTTGFIRYDFVTRDFDGDSIDYDVHSGSVGVEHDFSSTLTLLSSLGGWHQDKDGDSNKSGFHYDVTLAKTLQRGLFTFGGSGGYDENFQDVEEDEDFTKFWSVTSRVSYQLLEPLNGYVDGFYRLDEDSSNRQWKTWRVNCGLTWAWRWAALTLDYRHSERNDDVDTADYTDNRVMLMFTASRLFQW